MGPGGRRGALAEAGGSEGMTERGKGQVLEVLPGESKLLTERASATSGGKAHAGARLTLVGWCRADEALLAPKQGW